MSELRDRQLIYDWNMADDQGHHPGPVGLIDETLYEAFHAAGAAIPDLAMRCELLRAMSRLRIQGANLGLLRAESAADIGEMARVIEGEKLAIAPIVTIGLEPAAVALATRLVESAGPLDLAVVVPASQIHRVAEGVGLEDVLERLDRVLGEAETHGLRVRLMAHDASRAHPGALRRMIERALRHRVAHLCLWDSAGAASPTGTQRILEFVRAIVEERAGRMRIGWFGRNDRDLAVINALHGLHHGAETLHATALGLGHGAGSVPLDTLLANLQLLELLDRDLAPLKEYCQIAATAFGVTIPVNYPIFGGDAFRTATGVHAAAIIKAQAKGDHWLADRVYSGVPAGAFGLHQVIDVGPMSGESNVIAWLRHHGHEPERDLVKRIIARAKSTTHILTAAEIEEEIRAFAAADASGGRA
jgi:2-isopropylmalate synthase